MSDNLPYMNAYGFVTKVFDKAKTATQPPRFTNDFLYTTLAIKSKSARPIIPLMKRLGLLNSDGTPTSLYGEFRNSNKSKRAIADGIRKAYAELFSRNEYVYDLDVKDLTELVAEATGLAKTSANLKAIVSTFEALNKYADFVGIPAEESEEVSTHDEAESIDPKMLSSLGMNLSYTINLNLP